MTDRELLEKAAKAAGLGEVWYLDGSDTPYVGPRYEIGQPVRYSTFQPLTDDGDALRLAVRLALNVAPSGTYTAVNRFGRNEFVSESFGADPYAATRRAIVRAAASIGESHGKT